MATDPLVKARKDSHCTYKWHDGRLHHQVILDCGTNSHLRIRREWATSRNGSPCQTCPSWVWSVYHNKAQEGLMHCHLFHQETRRSADPCHSEHVTAEHVQLPSMVTTPFCLLPLDAAAWPLLSCNSFLLRSIRETISMAASGTTSSAYKEREHKFFSKLLPLASSAHFVGPW